MLSYRFDPIRGSSSIDWRNSSLGGPPLDPPEECDQAETDEPCCVEDFEISLEPD